MAVFKLLRYVFSMEDLSPTKHKLFYFHLFYILALGYIVHSTVSYAVG